MSARAGSSPASDRAELVRGIVRRLAQLAAILVLQGVILVVTSGQPGWRMAWAYLASYVVLIGLNGMILLRRHPDLIAERGRIEATTRGWDKVLIVLLSITSLATLAVAGLDRRFHWTPALGLVVVPGAGFVLYLLGFALVGWARAVPGPPVRAPRSSGRGPAPGSPAGSAGSPPGRECAEPRG